MDFLNSQQNGGEVQCYCIKHNHGCSFFSEVQRILLKLLNTLDRLLVCHIATPSPMCDQREESLRRPEEGGTAGDLGFELILLLVQQSKFLLDY